MRANEPTGHAAATRHAAARVSLGRIATLVAVKELRETLRDRKTLVLMVLAPLVLYPLLFLGLGQATAVQVARLQAERLPVAVLGPAPPGLTVALGQLEATPLVSPPWRGQTDSERLQGAKELVTAGAVAAAIVVPDDAPGALRRRDQLALPVVYDGARDRSREAHGRLLGAVASWAQALRAERFAELELRPEVVEPVDSPAVNVAPPARQGGWLLGQILPLLVSFLMIGAAFYPAVDLTAGEKERGTLQTLLTAPVPPLALVLGKYLAVVALAVGTGFMNVASIALVAVSLPLPEGAEAELALDVTPVMLLLVTACLVLLGMMFGALMMTIAVTARSFKEAQNYLTPVYMLSLFPLMLTTLPGVALGPVTALIPVANLALVLKALLVGGADAGHVALALGSTMAWVLLAVVAAAKVFQMESVLLGDDGVAALNPLRAGRGGADVPRRIRPEALRVGEALTLLGLVLLALFYGSMALGLADVPVVGLLHATQWAFLLLPTLAFTRLVGASPRVALALQRAQPSHWVAGVGFGLGSWWVAAWALGALGDAALPAPPPALEALAAELEHLARSPGGAVLLFSGVALAPAICEEILFRGAVFGALSRRSSPATAVAVSAVLFGIFHLNLQQLPVAVAIGLVLGTLRHRSGSVWPGVALHALHNGLSVASQAYVGEERLQDPVWAVVAFGPAVALGILSAQRFGRRQAPTR